MRLLQEIRTYLAVGWSRLRIFFNKPLSKDPIPEGRYCYQFMSDMKYMPNGELGFDIKTCPYFHYLGRYKTACTYLGYLGDDPAHGDSCKLCGEKEQLPTEDSLSNTDENL